MKVNNALVDAVMMLSFIILVLVGTSEFSNALTKDIIMIILAVIGVAMVVVRVLSSRRQVKE